MASVGINLIKIIGVHPLYVILYRGWGHSMLAISSKLKRVWRWITFPLLAEIIQFVNFFLRNTHLGKWGLFMYYFDTSLQFVWQIGYFLKLVKRGIRNNSVIKCILLVVFHQTHIQNFPLLKSQVLVTGRDGKWYNHLDHFFLEVPLHFRLSILTERQGSENF